MVPTFIQIPKYLQYFTAGIEYHHIHHMTTSIPGYKLKEYHEANKDEFNQFEIVQAFQNIRNFYRMDFFND